LGISQVSGQIFIGSDTSSHLIERSSREGLEHNGAFERLKRLVKEVLAYAEDRRLDFRERAGLSRRASGDVSQAKNLANLKAVTRAVSKLPQHLRAPLVKAIAKDSSALNASLDEIDEYQKLLQSRASLGLVVAQVIHEGRRILNPVATAGKALAANLEHLTEVSKKGDVVRKQSYRQILLINDGTKGLSKLFKRLDPVSGRRRGRPTQFLVKEVVDSSLNLFEDALADNHIKVVAEISPNVTAYGYVEDLQAAVLNILENAIYWLSSTEISQPTIEIDARIENAKIYLSLSNNGPLIDDAYVPRLFQAGSSLRVDGTGLGLAIAREACRASKGDLFFDQSRTDTTFVIQFPVTEWSEKN